MKLTNKNRRRLESIRDTLARGVNYLMQPDVAVALRRDNMQSTNAFTSEYPDYKGQKFVHVDKEIGSELCLIYSALHKLEQALAETDDTGTPGV